MGTAISLDRGRIDETRSDSYKLSAKILRWGGGEGGFRLLKPIFITSSEPNVVAKVNHLIYYVLNWQKLGMGRCSWEQCEHASHLGTIGGSKLL
jgi:hypothetical protein